MPPPRCPNCGCAATGPPLHGTPLVLCPACWTVVDPTAPPPKAPAEVPVAVEEAEPGPPPAPVLARLPPRPPRPRPVPSVTRRGLTVLGVLILAAVAGYGGWLVRAYYPDFRDVSAPGDRFTLAFPGDPSWQTGGDGIDVTGNFTRWYRGNRHEVYRVQVSRRAGTASPDPAADEMVALRKATELAGPGTPSRPAYARIGAMPGHACADFTRVNVLDVEMTVTAGRVIVADDRYYVLTVTGPNVGGRDWRVRRFFDSFRLAGR